MLCSFIGAGNFDEAGGLEDAALDTSLDTSEDISEEASLDISSELNLELIGADGAEDVTTSAVLFPLKNTKYMPNTINNVTTTPTKNASTVDLFMKFKAYFSLPAFTRRLFLCQVNLNIP